MCDFYAVELTNENRRSKKLRFCGECGAPIFKGMLYAYYFGLTDNEPTEAATCLRCNALRSAVTTVERTLGEDGCYYFGTLFETPDEFLRHMSPEDRRNFEITFPEEVYDPPFIAKQFYPVAYYLHPERYK